MKQSIDVKAKPISGLYPCGSSQALGMWDSLRTRLRNTSSPSSGVTVGFSFQSCSHFQHTERTRTIWDGPFAGYVWPAAHPGKPPVEPLQIAQPVSLEKIKCAEVEQRAASMESGPPAVVALNIHSDTCIQ